MSHPVNDQIIDNAINTVAFMNDDQVMSKLADHGVSIGGQDIDSLRDILTDIVCDDLMSRPGPHG
tara:strand:+ start:90 stop:284 length:195 start_codon:yes stop_codon:yes gene_type:complete